MITHFRPKDIQYKNWEYCVWKNGSDQFLQIRFNDPTTGERQYCRIWFLGLSDRKITSSDIIKTAWMATLAAEEHEARENFRYKGKRIFGPHFDIDKMVDFAIKENLDI